MGRPKISRRMSWFLQASASTVKKACTSLMKKQRLMQIITQTSCWQNHWTTVTSCLANGLFSNTQQVNQQWLAACCPDFIDEDSWPPNRPDINPLDYHVWGSMFETFCHLNPRPEVLMSCSTDENLERFITRLNPQVDCQFQEKSASLCKRRWRTFWAFTVKLLIDFRLRALAVFCNFESKHLFENVAIN